MQTAASWGLVFRCDPMTYLDRPVTDRPVLLAVLDVALSRLEKARKEAMNGQR